MRKSLLWYAFERKRITAGIFCFVLKFATDHEMQPGLADLFCHKVPLQWNAQRQAGSAVFADVAADSATDACQDMMLVITLIFAVDMAIIEEGERINISIMHRYYIFCAKVDILPMAKAR